MNYPYVEGLSTFEEKRTKNEIVCYGKHINGRSCDYCSHVDQCKKCTIKSGILSRSEKDATLLERIRSVSP